MSKKEDVTRPGKVKKKSIWEEVLADVSEGTQVPDSHLLVLGQHNS